MKPFRFASAVALLAFAVSPARAQLDSRDLAALQGITSQLPGRSSDELKSSSPLLSERMHEHGVPAVSITYFQDGQIRWARAFGEVKAGSRVPADVSTLFQAASLSKTVTAAGALQAIDRGQLSLDENLAKWLKRWNIAFPAGRGPVTLRQLLSHTGGASVSGYPGYAAGEPVPTLAQSLAGVPPAITPPVAIVAAPGGQFSYSGGGYSIVQRLLDQTLQGAFKQGIAKGVLRPAGMIHSSFRQFGPDENANRRAWGHIGRQQPVEGGAYHYPELAAAGLWTTPTDYARFLIALQRSWSGQKGALLRHETARTMMTPVLGNYGLGLQISERGGRLAISHSGVNEGFVSQYVAHLDGAGEGVVIMTNGAGGGALIGPILAVLVRHYDWMRADRSSSETIGQTPGRD